MERQRDDPSENVQRQQSGNALKFALCGTVLLGLVVVGISVLKAASKAKDDQLTSLQLIAQTTTQPQISKVRSELEDSVSQDEVNEIYSTVNNSKGVSWGNWFAQNKDNFVTLRIILMSRNSIFSCIYNSTEVSCGKFLKKSWNGQTSLKSNPSSVEVSRARNITRSKLVRFLTIGAPTDFPDFPESYEIHLKIFNKYGVRWESWFPLNADKVIQLTGTFSPSDIHHLFSVMKHLEFYVLLNLFENYVTIILNKMFLTQPF